MSKKIVDINSIKVTARELAAALGLSDHRVRELARQEVIPAAVEKQFPLVESIKMYVAYLRKRIDAPNLSAARKEKLGLENQLLHMAVQERGGKLVSVDEVLSRLLPATAAAKQRILTSSLSDDEKEGILSDIQLIFEEASRSEIKPKDVAE